MNGTQHVVYIQEENSTSYYMKLEKSADANLSFSEGLLLNFTDSQPQHITYYFSSMNTEQEDTNLRLKDQDGLSAVSFRCGNAGFIRVNENQMVDFYNFSLATSDSSIIWTKVNNKLKQFYYIKDGHCITLGSKKNRDFFKQQLQRNIRFLSQ